MCFISFASATHTIDAMRGSLSLAALNLEGLARSLPSACTVSEAITPEMRKRVIEMGKAVVVGKSQPVNAAASGVIAGAFGILGKTWSAVNWKLVKKGATIVPVVFSVGSFVKSYWPTETEKIEKETIELKLKVQRTDADSQLKALKARQELKDSIVDNANGEKDSEGFPVACKHLADKYAKLASYTALQEIKDDFRSRK